MNQPTRYVRPAPDLKVRDAERGGHLPEAGATVPDSSYWRRRLRDGDVVEVAPPKPTAKGAKE